MSAIMNKRKINSVISQIIETEKVFIIGSDEHLDFLSDIKKDLTEITLLIKETTDALETDFNKISIDEAKEIVVSTHPIFFFSQKAIEFIKNLRLDSQLKTTIEAFIVEVHELSEITNDLVRFKINDTSDIADLLKS